MDPWRWQRSKDVNKMRPHLKLVRNNIRYSCQYQRTVQLVLLRGKAKFSSDVLSDAVNSLDNTTPVKHAALSILQHETISDYF